MTSSEIDKLINQISKLPGLGRRSAQRIALYLLKNKDRSLLPLLQCLQEAKKKGETAAQEEMKSITGGIPLPPGMKLPF